MERDDRSKFDSIYTSKIKAGKRRTYFFDVKKTKGEDYYVTLTESTKKFNADGYEKHKIFIYKEDFNQFITQLQETFNYVKTELMPDYDYENGDRRETDWDSPKKEKDHKEDMDW